MADVICRWRNGTPKTVMELVNSIPHRIVSIDEFRDFMANKWEGDFFRTPYQLACQLGLYCESEDGLFYPRFDHDIDEEEAKEYLYFWLPRYYVPNPYTRKDGFQLIDCPTYVLKSLYEYTKQNPNCDYKDASESCFHEPAINNNDIIKNYINKYSRVLSFSKDGKLNITNIDPKKVFFDMNRNDKKAFFDNFGVEKNSPKIQKTSEISLQKIYYGAPGTGKSHIINEMICNQSVIRTTFHPDSDYSTFVGCYKPTTKEEPRYTSYGEKAVTIKDEEGNILTEDRIVYEFVPQAFFQAYVKAWKFYAEAGENDEIKQQYLVIEEINRGNCAQIFGDLFQLLDRNDVGFSDYPIQTDNDMCKQLAKAFKASEIALSENINACYKGEDVVEKVLRGEILLLPNNLHILATMNTSDQSLFPIDSAFKRRWDWQYMPICKGHDEQGNEYKWKISADSNEYDWWSFLDKINHEIASVTNSEDKKLGFFFCKAQNGVISAQLFVSKVVFYLWNDVFKDYAFESSAFKDLDDSILSFNKFYTTDEIGNTKVCTDKVELFLDNLGVSIVEETTEEDEEFEDNKDGPKDYTKYSINEEGEYPKSMLATNLIMKYVELHPDRTVEEVVSNWMQLNIKISHFVENQEQFKLRTDTPRTKEVTWGEDKMVWVTTNGWTPENTKALVEAVNEKEWNLSVKKID